MSEEPEKIIDIKTRKKITELPSDDAKPAHFLNTWKRFSKDTKVKSIMIITIDENEYVTWGYLAENDHHLALAALTLEDLREEIREELFGSANEEEK